MLTLLVTVLATAYFVVPELLTRFVVSFYFVRKAPTGTRSEEILRAAFWAGVPVAFAWITRNIGWGIAPPNIAANTRVVFSSLYSEKYFEQNSAAFYTAFHGFALFNLYLLYRTYAIVIIAALVFGWIARRLGIVRGYLRRWPGLTRLLFWAFLPRISEWDVALSTILVRDPKELIVRIDVLTKNETLYRGTVFEKRINSDGDLATLILEDAQRLIRSDYLRDRAAYEEQKAANPTLEKPDTEDYWHKIPGEIFLLNGSEIATVNVRHVRPVAALHPDRALLNAFAALQQQLERRLDDRADTSSSPKPAPDDNLL